MVPTECFLTKGVGYHKDKLTSFEEALRAAKIAQFNLVQVSSIFPPQCKLIPPARGLKKMHAGQIVFTVMSRNQTDENRRLVSAAVGLALPSDRNTYGYLSEYHSFGETEQVAGDYAEDLAATMLAHTLGVEFNPDEDYDTRREIYRISGKIVRSQNICQTAIGKRNGIWTTVLAAAVFII